MTEYAFFANKPDRWRKELASLWGNLDICPQVHQLVLPWHTSAELSSLNDLRIWGEGQNPCHNLAFLVVRAEDTMGERHYDFSLVWADPRH